MIRVIAPKEFSLKGLDTNGQISIQVHPLLSRRLTRNKHHLRPLLSSHDQAFIGHFSQRFPSLFRKGSDGKSQHLRHIGTDGKVDAGSSGNLLLDLRVSSNFLPKTLLPQEEPSFSYL
jgi:hypothetical protein